MRMPSNSYYVTTIYSWLLVASLITSIRASAENDTSIPLILPVTADSPDVLGISLISGIYGPGTWTAWFLNIFASGEELEALTCSIRILAYFS